MATTTPASPAGAPLVYPDPPEDTRVQPSTTQAQTQWMAAVYAATPQAGLK